MIKFTLCEVFGDDIRHILATYKDRSVIVGSISFVSYPEWMDAKPFYLVSVLDDAYPEKLNHFDDYIKAFVWFEENYTSLIHERVFAGH